MKTENRVIFTGSWGSIPKYKDNEHRKVHKKPNQITLKIKKMLKGVGPIDSMLNFYTNGKRQWGHTWEDIIDSAELKHPFWRFVQDANQFMTLRYQVSNYDDDKIDNNDFTDNELRDLVEQMSWAMEDAFKSLRKLCNEISKSGILDTFADLNCIKSTGKRLGLQELVDRTYNSCPEAYTNINQIASFCKAMN